MRLASLLSVLGGTSKAYFRVREISTETTVGPVNFKQILWVEFKQNQLRNNVWTEGRYFADISYNPKGLGMGYTDTLLRQRRTHKASQKMYIQEELR